MILPISAALSSENMGSAFYIPSAGENASISQTLPQNVERAVVSLSACGQATEEFWYSNTLNSLTDTFDSTAGTLYGFSPFVSHPSRTISPFLVTFWGLGTFSASVASCLDSETILKINTDSGIIQREVQLVIDSQYLAGVSWPFPIIFTGGIGISISLRMNIKLTSK